MLFRNYGINFLRHEMHYSNNKGIVDHSNGKQSAFAELERRDREHVERVTGGVWSVQNGQLISLARAGQSKKAVRKAA